MRLTFMGHLLIKRKNQKPRKKRNEKSNHTREEREKEMKHFDVRQLN